MFEANSEGPEPKKSRYLVGIDLGTTNCAVAYFDTLNPSSGIQTLPITQWESEGLLSEALVLPSFCYLLPKSEVKKGRFALPWHRDEDLPEEVVGKMAATFAISNPGRVIHSAKSWLCHSFVDREEPILPWHSDEVLGSKRRSPVAAAATYLRHLRDCWNHKMAVHQPEYCLQNQTLTITVPASFDESAQRLTLAAAEMAGFTTPHLRLLEEPQAAFYHLLEEIHASGNHYDDLLATLPGLRQADQDILICDIGGGTTDFSLFRIGKFSPASPWPKITRLAVSDHILLGGDNIDLAVAAVLEEKFKKKYGTSASSAQWAQLMGQSRQIKERSLTASESESKTIEETFLVSIAGSGSGIFTSAQSVEITRSELWQIVAEGFYPFCREDTVPATARSGFQEWNLPYAADSAITHHLANFLRGRPIDAVLYTGGSLKPPFLRERITRQIETWKDRPIAVLANDDLDLAVARGAAAFAKATSSNQQQIGGGYPRTLYIEVFARDASNLMCIVPKGFDSNGVLEISEVDLRVRIGEPVVFNLFSSTRRDNDRVGQLIAGEIPDLHRLPSLQRRLDLRTESNRQAHRGEIRVGLKVRIEPTGLLALSCYDKDSSHTWSLEFNLQERPIASHSPQVQGDTQELPSEARRKNANDAIDALYGKRKLEGDIETAPGQLVQQLETILACERIQWDLSTLRSLWVPLKEGIHRRGRSLAHEATWMNLAGYALRPGYGADLDRYRVAELWAIYQQGPVFKDELRIKNQWWILWRRVAGGLSRSQQEIIFAKIIPSIRKGNEATAEMYMLAGSLELVDMEKKLQLGKLLVEQIAAGRHHCIDQKIWALSRLASRLPIHGGAENLVRPSFVESWIRALQPLDCRKPPLKRLTAFYALGGRLVQDREFDLSPEVRQVVLAKLKECQASPEQIQPVLSFVPQSLESKSELIGESLPLGFFIA